MFSKPLNTERVWLVDLGGTAVVFFKERKRKRQPHPPGAGELGLPSGLQLGQFLPIQGPAGHPSSPFLFPSLCVCLSLPARPYRAVEQESAVHTAGAQEMPPVWRQTPWKGLASLGSHIPSTQGLGCDVGQLVLLISQ